MMCPLAVAMLVSIAAAGGELAELEAERAEAEAQMIELQRQQLELETEIKAMQYEYARRQLELDESQAELTRLAVEIQALELEERGDYDRADFLRRRGELDQERAALTARSREVLLRRQEQYDPLTRRRKELALQLRELRERGDDSHAVELELREIQELSGLLRLELKIEELLLDVDKELVQERQARLRAEEAAAAAGGAERAARAEQHALEARTRRRFYEIDLVFVELERELLEQRSDIRRALDAPGLDPQRKAELNRQDRTLSEDFGKLGRARRTHQQEKELGRFEHRLRRHFDQLDRAGESASSREAEALADERERLRAAVRALVDAAGD